MVDFEEVLDEKVEKISDHFFVDDSPKAIYEYDFGDSWEHDVVLEKIVTSDGGEYPRCLTGKRACPPEDCGRNFQNHVYILILKKLVVKL
jgi:hypothetical protein